MTSTNTAWDVAVIGTGMGGATLGYALARAGHRVVFLEKGRADFPDASGDLALDSEDPDVRLKNGGWPTPITGSTGGPPSRFLAPLGCGSGGSTLLYAAALERFDPIDFGRGPEGRPPAAGWPLSFDQMLPYYRQAEALFRVRGTWDPLRPDHGASLLAPPPLTGCDEHFAESLRAAGLHPYRLHVAFAYEPDCSECLGYVCRRKCKGDARTTCVEPALATGNAQLLDGFDVRRLEADAGSVREVVGRRHGEDVSIRARIVVLSAGAFFSPVLLLNSANAHWPAGLANRSGQVGRNLMFHASDHIAVWPRGDRPAQGPRKTLAFRDFYVHEGKKLGAVQSTGRTVGYGYIVYFMKSQFDRSRWRWLKPLRPLLRIPAYLASYLFGRATVFATIVEDSPYPENRVVPDPHEPSGMRFEYVVRAELRERVLAMRRLLKKAFARHRSLMLSHDVDLNYGHPCGTCRFGTDPATSVLDENNKAHDLANLYVVDASFMPTSGGANPGLTIAANALRVADRISGVLQQRGPAA